MSTLKLILILAFFAMLTWYGASIAKAGMDDLINRKAQVEAVYVF